MSERDREGGSIYIYIALLVREINILELEENAQSIEYLYNIFYFDFRIFFNVNFS